MPRWLLAMSADELLTPAEIAQAYAANWAVTDWYIDGTTGSDTNNGITALTPIKTGAELQRRLGSYALWSQSVTVHVLANGMTDALILCGAMIVAGTRLDVVGTPTELATSSVASYSAVSHATATASHLKAATVLDWSPYLWKRVRITSGTRAGAVCWIAKSSPHGSGNDVARISPPCNINQTSTTTQLSSVVSPSAGDAIAIESLPYVPEITLQLDGPIDNTAGVQWVRRQWSIQNVDCPILRTKTTSALVSSKNIVYGCRVSSIDNEFVGQTPFYNMVAGCSIFGPAPSLNAAGISGLFVAQNCLFGDNGLLILYAGAMNRYVSSLFQSCQLAGQLGSAMVCSNVQVFDVANASHGGLAPCDGVFTNVSGRDNAGYGLGLLNCTLTRFTGTCNMQGSVANGALLSAPVVPFAALSDLLQPADYAKKGTTAAMTAGSITVTVPWYDNATQKVTASHANFAGTPGILSVQQISTTQFTITSSSALDTSTVNWQISPLGRNILISTL